MEKIKWKYDSESKMWWTGETVPWANDGFSIMKKQDYYELHINIINYRPSFKKLKSAKTVAQLLRNG